MSNVTIELETHGENEKEQVLFSLWFSIEVVKKRINIKKKLGFFFIHS